MTVAEIAQALGLRLLAGAGGLDREVRYGYASDLLSDVVARAPKGCLWLTLQTHENVVAVALLVDAAGVVITGGREPGANICSRAEAEGLPLFASPASTFELSGRLYALLAGEKRGA
ncbi:MAG: DRTGG domain-containing protein [Clostridia bacterium]|jgi:predicted transcriptional regulator|nr:DRTGG domain-containing protein [Clostridia bacterium]MDH7573154.1 DRTGG domain-containing protein [Clostridia bacterium]